jgi:hypothetical protein
MDDRVQALLEAADDTPWKKTRPCDIVSNKFIECEKGWKLIVFQTNASSTFQEGHLYI